MKTLTQAELKARVSYDPKSGLFTRVSDAGRWKAGTQIGSINTLGYCAINFGGYPWLAHRLAFLWVTGEWPKYNVDHINGNRSDNRWDNLRDIPQRMNTENTKVASKHNRSGLLGVTLHKACGKYSARIYVAGKGIHLGLFADPLEAHEAYVLAKRKLHAGCTL